MPFSKYEQSIIRKAQGFLFREINTNPVVNSPDILKDYLRLYYAGEQQEKFSVIYLDAQHRMLSHRMEFAGSLTQTSVYPREIVKQAILQGAASVVLVHNHPSGNPEPSRADEMLTNTLKQALALVDVRTLDHFVVGHTVTSFAERGLI